jgi:hypothetical protein
MSEVDMVSEHLQSRRNSRASLEPYAGGNCPPRVYSVGDFCRLYGIGRTSAYAEIGAGRLIAVKAGRRTLISHDAAEAWLDALPAANASK